MQFNRNNLKTIRADISAALASVEAKHDVTFDLGNIRFGDTNFRGKLECNAVADKNGKAVDPNKVKFEQNYFRFGLDKDAYGKTFSKAGRKYTVTGINPRAKKYPVKCTSPNGQVWKMPVSALPHI